MSLLLMKNQRYELKIVVPVQFSSFFVYLVTSWVNRRLKYVNSEKKLRTFKVGLVPADMAALEDKM